VQGALELLGIAYTGSGALYGVGLLSIGAVLVLFKPHRAK
jgi:hypothetical protein